MAISLIDRLQSMTASIRLIKPVTVHPPVIDTWVKSWADEFDVQFRAIDLMEWANKLTLATGLELDNRWGLVYEMPRWSGEDDIAYRKRLQVCILVHTASGTRANCEQVLDLVVGDPGSCRIESLWPAIANVTFDTDKGLRAATTYRDQIEFLLDRMVAKGITWQLFLPYLDYTMSMKMAGTDYTHYDMSIYLGVHDEEFEYHMRPTLVSRLTKAISSDLLARTTFVKPYSMGGIIQAWQYSPYLVDTVLLRRGELGWQIDLISSKQSDKSGLFDMILWRFGEEVVLSARYTAKKARDLATVFNTAVWNRKDSTYGASMRVVG